MIDHYGRGWVSHGKPRDEDSAIHTILASNNIKGNGQHALSRGKEIIKRRYRSDLDISYVFTPLRLMDGWYGDCN